MKCDNNNFICHHFSSEHFQKIPVKICQLRLFNYLESLVKNPLKRTYKVNKI